MGSPQPDSLLEGLRMLKTSALLYIVSSLLVGASLVLIPFAAPPFSTNVFMVFAAMAWVVVAGVIGAVLSLVALLVYLVPAFGRLERFDQASFGTPRRLVKTGYAGGLVAMILGLMAAFVHPFLAFSMLLVAALLLLVGTIGIAVGMFRLDSKLGVREFLVAGVLFIVGLFIWVLMFVAWVMVFVGCSTAIRRAGP